jgi:hypothetical protein
MKITTPGLRRFANFETMMACLIGMCWRGTLLYMLLWSMCLGGNCGIWPEPALAAPLPTIPVISASTTDSAWVPTDCPFPIIGSFRKRQGVTMTKEPGVGALMAGLAPLMDGLLLAHAD